MAEPARPDLADDDGRGLVEMAVAAVRSGLEQRPVPGLVASEAPALTALGASFVTLERDGRLLGCVGTIEPVRPLFEDVMANAYRSAFADPRLPSCTAADFEAMDVKVSVLGPLRPLDVTSPVDLAGSLRPGVDGVLVADGDRRATFLPAVWAKVPSADDFVRLLLDKAGIGPGWPPNVSVHRYLTVEFTGPGPRPGL